MCAWSHPPPRCWRAHVASGDAATVLAGRAGHAWPAPAGSAAPREYPLAANAEYPLAREAERTIRNGVPLLQRYLPFSLANLLERMWLSLGIILALLLPLSRIIPPLYEFRIRSRVFRWYAQLRDIEDRVTEHADSTPALLQELDALELRVGKVVIPLSHADELYALRNHINLIRQKLSR